MRGAVIAAAAAVCLSATAAAAHDVEIRGFNLPVDPNSTLDEYGEPYAEPAVADVTYWTDSYDAPSGQMTTSVPARSRAFGRFEYGARASEDSEPLGRYRLRRTGLAGGFGLVTARIRTAETREYRIARRYRPKD